MKRCLTSPQNGGRRACANTASGAHSGQPGRRLASGRNTLCAAVVLVAIALAVGDARPAHATVQYDYTGANFTGVSGPYTTSDRVTGYVDVASPLPPSASSNPVITAYSFSDGINTISNVTVNSQLNNAGFSTDQLGNIIAANINVTSGNPPNGNYNAISIFPSGSLGLINTADCCFVTGATVFGGTWSGPTTILGTSPSLYLSYSPVGPYSNTPLPTSMIAEITLATSAPALPNTSMLVGPLPSTVTTLQQAASDLGYTSFDWQQVITSEPAPSPIMQVGNPVPLTAPPSFLDPPPGGYTYCATTFCGNNYPFFYDPAQLATGCAHASGGVCVTKIETGPAPTLNFFDAPSDPCLADPGGGPSLAWRTVSGVAAACSNAVAPAGSQLAFTTYLVGIRPTFIPGTDCRSFGTCVALGSFSWTDTFNGTTTIPGNGGATASDQEVDAGSGIGGIMVSNASVPEPSSAMILSSGLFLCMLIARWRRVHYE